MSVFDMYCCFCAGPLGRVRAGFVDDVKSGFKGKSWPPKDGKWRNPKGYPVPDKAVKEIVRITHEDNQYWEETVVVGPQFKPTWVSPPVYPSSYGDLMIHGSSNWQRTTDEHYNVVHINCLSLLCRRLDITPEQWWLSFYGPISSDETPSRYRILSGDEEERNGLKYGLDYYEMERRTRQWFGYSVEDYIDPVTTWWDIDYWDDCNWIFASPAIFPRVPELPAPLQETPTSGPPEITTPGQKVVFTPDLLFTILDFAVPYVPEEIVTEQMVSQHYTTGAPKVVQSVNTMLSMLQVNKCIYNWITQSRQDLFFRIIWQLGYMLPACPLDWKSWNAVNDPLPPLVGVPIDAIPRPHNTDRDTTLSNAQDWRAYMIKYLREDDPHTRSRYRLHRLHIQHARGMEERLEDGNVRKYWSCGKFGVGTALECPEPYEWEKDDYVPFVDVSNLGDWDLDDPVCDEPESDEDEDEHENGGIGTRTTTSRETAKIIYLN